jgi:hypothetical protein
VAQEGDRVGDGALPVRRNRDRGRADCSHATLSLLDVPEGNGSAFGTLAVVQPKDFRFVRGEDLVQFYTYPPDGRRAFCRV